MGNKSSSQSASRAKGCTDPPRLQRHPLLTAPVLHQSTTSLHYPSGTDSGYMTSPAETERIKAAAWRRGRSQLSLNEPFLFEVPPYPPQVPPVQVFAVPPPNYKQFKKWQKKQRKIMKKLGPLPVSVLPMGPQMPPLPHIAVPPYSRAVSVDNLNCQFLNEYAEVQSKNRNFWSGKRDTNRHHFDGEVSKCSPCPKSTISSGCSNFPLSSSQRNSTACNNLCDQSRTCSVSTIEPSPRRMQRLSPNYSKFKTDATISGPVKIDKSAETINTKNRFETIAEELKISSEIEELNYPQTESISNNVEREESNGHVDLGRFRNIENEIIDDSHPSTIKESNPIKNRTLLKMNDSYESSSSEHSIPIRITSEAKQILDKNEKIFNKSSPDINRENHPEIDERSDNNLKNCIQVPYQTSERSHETNSLKRNVDHGSTLSSLTLSSNIKTEVSEIDFSWVDDVENRLEKEIASIREDYSRHQMPVRYFGVDELVDNKLSDVEAGKDDDKRKVFPKTIQVFDGPDARKELSNIHSDVKNKAAMFDKEALRVETHSNQFFEKRPPMMGKYRARSTPRNANSMYIPQPDYRDSDFDDTNHYFGAKSCQDLSQKRNGITQKVNETSSAPRTTHLPPNTYESQLINPRHQDYQNELLQRNRTYDATEYYRHNAARRNAEKTWRASIAY